MKDASGLRPASATLKSISEFWRRAQAAPYVVQLFFIRTSFFVRYEIVEQPHDARAGNLCIGTDR
jgi:hypothetical protein